MDSEIELVLISETESDDESESYTMVDDSDEDPTYDLVQETQKDLSKLSIKKNKRRVEEEHKIPKLDKNEVISFELVEKMIHDGKLEKLRNEDCKIYLKRFGLKLTDKKEVLLRRIKEHLEIKDGSGERKYPISSFVMNCKGDACKGDVVMFQQNVTKKMDQNGMRTVAGRIISESYGADKQQHTFTIEVLWSKGKKVLPPLHPLRIKGRCLYRYKTLRQRWENEEERERVLREKHERGQVARTDREKRIQEKEIRMIMRENRMKKNTSQREQAPIIYRGPKLQDKTNLTTNNRENIPHVKITPTPWAPPLTTQPSQYNNRAQLAPHVRPVPSYFGHDGNVVDQVNYFQRPVPRQNASDRWDPQRYNNAGNVYGGNNSDRWDPRRERTSDGNHGHGSRCNGPSVRREMCQFYMQNRCRYGATCKYSHGA